MDTLKQNGGFSSQMGFIIACIGSAIGIGNIWMFPYRMGQYGGGAFLVPYLIFVVLFGVVGLSAEFAVGRRAGTGTLGAYQYCFERHGKGKVGRAVGWLPLLGSLGIAIGYSVIIGWVLKFLAGSITGSMLKSDPESYFAAGAANFGNIPWHLIGVAATIAIMMFGATKGIEKINNFMMPAFFVLFIILAVYVGFLPGAAAGYKFMFTPHWKELLNPMTWVMAMGQAFFSLSITGSGMIVYGTYMKKGENIPKSAILTTVFDTVSALLAAVAIIPAVFAYGIRPNAGPPLIFITLPKVFQQMPMGRLFAILFFVSVLFAGIPSLINMFEAVIESCQKRFRMSRKLSAFLCFAITMAVGIFIEAEPRVDGWMDVVTIIISPLGAVLGAVAIYYVLGYKNIKTEIEDGCKKPLPKFFGPLAKYIYVPLALIVFILGLIFKGIG